MNVTADTSIARLVDVSYRYPEARAPAIDRCSWSIAPGAFALVTGRSGSGKSTLLRMLNGLVPHFSGGQFAGSVAVCGDSTRSFGPGRMSQHVGFVFQDPEIQVVASRVDEDIAFALEQRGVARAPMRKRVEELLDLLAIAPLRHRDPATLSGGERQRVAIAGALALHPRLLVLDEPTSQLDPWGAEDVLAALSRLNDDLGLTIVVAEHRLERLLHRVDVVHHVEAGVPDRGCSPRQYATEADPTGLPGIARVGRALGWHPVPLTVKEGRQRAGDILLPPPHPSVRASGDCVVSAHGLGVRQDRRWVLRDVDLDVCAGELVALVGRNGSGKTTLLRSLLGHHPIAAGEVAIAGQRGRELDASAIGKVTGYLPQQATTMLFAETAGAELEYTARQRGAVLDVDAALNRVGLAGLRDRHPRDLSGGERERLVLAIMLVGDPALLVLDEPTRGMDAWRKRDLRRILDDYRTNGGAVLMATHDVDLVAETADRVVMLGDDGIVASGPPEAVLGGSLTYTTQTQLVFGDAWLTPDQVIESARRSAG